MRLAAYNALCQGLTATEHVVQWRGAHVWKVGRKLFAVGFPVAGFPAPGVPIDGGQASGGDDAQAAAGGPADTHASPTTESDGAARAVSVTLKAAPDACLMLLERPGVVREPHLPRMTASGGWVRIAPDADLTEDEVAHYLSRSHAIVAAGLSRKRRAALGLDDDAASK